MNSQKTVAPVMSNDSKTTFREKHPNILVVDDDQVLLDLLGKVLKKLGFGVALADCGKEAIDLVRKAVPDVVLLDIKMPGMDGISVLKEIKAQDPDVEVVIMTGFASLDSAVEALKYGAFEYIRKPFDSLDHVIDAVRRGWERRKPRLEKRNLRIGLERRIYELKILYKMSRTIGYCSNRQEMTVQLLDSLNQIISYDLAISMLLEGSQLREMVLQVVNPSSSGLVEEAKSNLIDAFNSAAHSSIPADIPFDRILGEKNIVSSKTTEQKSQSGLTVAQRLDSFLNVPLMNEGNLVGMINLSSHLDRAFSPDDIRLIYTVASQMPLAVQRLKSIKATERIRMSKLAENMSDGAIMIDEDLEVVLVNTVAQKILDLEKPDIETIQNILGLDLKSLRGQLEKGSSDFVTRERKISSVTYAVTASVIKGTAGTFIGFVIHIRESSEEKHG